MQEILRLQPIYKEKIWGGRKLESFFQRNIPEGKIGESWEVSDYRKDLSVIQNGILKGKTLREAYQNDPERILGKPKIPFREFPLLVKIIDAQDRLSVQVHPDDRYAEEKDPESSGKKEAWYILQSDPKSEIVCGFSESLNRDSYRLMIERNEAEKPLQTFNAEKGNAFMITPGTIHAIGKGNLILEVQQSSDSTYRVYDYGRIGDDGKPRPLHIQKSLDVLNFQKSDLSEFLKGHKADWKFGERKILNRNDKFFFEILKSNDNVFLPGVSDRPLFRIITVISGRVNVSEETFLAGDSFILTAEGTEKNLSFQFSKNTEIALMGPGSDWCEYE